jgi:hypothetical protein
VATKPVGEPKRILLVVTSPGDAEAPSNWARQNVAPGDALYFCDPRGVGETRWTTKNPPNYVARSHVLLGRTVDAGRAWDIAATARFLREKHRNVPLQLSAENNAAILATYAALLEPDIDGVLLHRPPLSHMDSSAPSLLNVLRVCDVPDVLGMLAPRSLRISGVPSHSLKKVVTIYQAAGVPTKFSVR